jgi:integrase
VDQPDIPKRPSRLKIGLQVAGFVVGCALVAWCAQRAFSEGSAGLEKLRTADPTLIAVLLLSTLGSIVCSGYTFWTVALPIRRFRVLDMQAVNLMASLFNYAPVRLGLFLRCWILVCYETGSRFGDCMAFTSEHLQDDALAWTQSKTGDPLTRPLTPACLDAIDKMLAASPDGRILGWVCGRRMAMRHMRTLIDSVGIGGSSKFLRRSGATHVEMEQAGAGRLHLGHRSPQLFEQAYCDWSQLRTKTPKTPALV